MKCTNCGQDLEKGAKFCSNCGQNVEKQEISPKDLEETKVFHTGLLESEEDHQSEDTLTRGIDTEKIREAEKSEVEDYYNEEDLEGTRVMDPIDEEYYEDDGYYVQNEEEGFFEKLSRNKGIVIGVIIFLIAIIAFVALSRGNDGEGKEELVEEFIEALSARDATEVRKMIESPIPELQIDNAGVERLFSYIDSNPSFIEQTKIELERQSKYYDDGKEEDIEDLKNNITLKKKDKNQYTLQITPYYMNIKVGAKDTKIFIEDKEVGASDRDDFSGEYGPFMPGIYKIGAKYDTEHAQLETEQIVELMTDSPDMTKQIQEFQLQLEVNYITISTEDDSAKIILDGADTGKRVRDLEAGKLGPVNADSKFKLVLETPFGEFESKEYLMSESGDRVDISIPMINDSLKEDIISVVNVFIKEDLKAKEELSMDAYSVLINPEKDKMAGLIEEMKEEGYRIESELEKVRYDLNGIMITKHEDKYYATALVNYDVKETYLWDISTETVEENKNLTVYLRFNEGNSKWEIFELESANTFDERDVKEFNY